MHFFLLEFVTVGEAVMSLVLVLEKVSPFLVMLKSLYPRNIQEREKEQLSNFERPNYSKKTWEAFRGCRLV